jgi:hypothetical protein
MGFMVDKDEMGQVLSLSLSFYCCFTLWAMYSGGGGGRNAAGSWSNPVVTIQEGCVEEVVDLLKCILGK